MTSITNLPDYPAKDTEKGSSLIEVLIALFIMMILMLGILQMFSVAYMENMGVAARTEMTYKAQQFVENLRYLQRLSLRTNPPPVFVPNTGINFPLLDSGGVQQIDPAVATYWNSANAGVVDPGAPYILRYSVTNTNPVSTMWAVTVIVEPTGSRVGDVGSRYVGMGIKGKGVVFSAEIPQQAP